MAAAWVQSLFVFSKAWGVFRGSIKRPVGPSLGVSSWGIRNRDSFEKTFPSGLKSTIDREALCTHQGSSIRRF